MLARVVRGHGDRDGKLVEDMWDWYAQDKAGDIGYLGEYTKEYGVGSEGVVRFAKGSSTWTRG